MTVADGSAGEARQICRAVARHLSGTGAPVVHVGRVARRLRSIGIELDLPAADGTRSVFIKVPRARGTLRSDVTATFTPQERDMAVQEFEALSYLHRQMAVEEADVGFVRPVALVEDVNALVLDRIDGPLLLDYLRRWDLDRRIGRGGSPPLDMLDRLGRTVGRHHAHSLSADSPHHDRLLKDVRDYAARLRDAGVNPRIVDAAIGAAADARAEAGLDRSVTGIYGLHLHHFVIGDAGGLTGIDPGLLLPMAPEEDVARLIIGLHCLCWSTPYVGLRLRPGARLQRHLLAGWRRAMKVDAAALRLCLVRQAMFRWLIALEGVSYRSWPPAAKRTFQGAVLDPFSRALARVLVRGDSG